MVNVKNTTELNAKVQYLGEILEVPAGKTVEMKEDAAKFIVTAIGFLTIEDVKEKAVEKKETKKVEEVKEDK